ncbi:unnamed protein product [Penicillium salamii]|nr:unnamed protein product [Penicillium salamii]
MAAPSGRKRGRPRTVTNDQEVPERRRQQLRLAQQAYRKRKETTIGNLQSRVQELETGVENLSNAFLSFSSLFLEQELLSQHPHIASALQDITHQCVALAKAATDEPSEALVHVKESPQPVATLDHTSPPGLVLDHTNSESSTDVEDIVRSVPKWVEGTPYQDRSLLPFGVVMTSPTTQFPYLTPPLSSSPMQDLIPSTIPNTTVEDERWTIAQRIVKTCCRHGYRLLVDSPNHSRVQQIFGSTLNTSERNRLISMFHAVNHDKIGDLVDAKANVLSALRAKLSTLTADQPQLSSRTWQIALESVSGDWMDCTGVRKYLHEKRIVFENFPDSTGRLQHDVSSSLDISKFIKCEPTLCDRLYIRL